MRQADLPRSGGGLLFLELQIAASQAEMAAPDSDRARRDDQHLLAASTAARDVLNERREPIAADIAARVIDEQRRANLDDEPACGAKAFTHRQRPALALLLPPFPSPPRAQPALLAVPPSAPHRRLGASRPTSPAPGVWPRV